MKFKKLKVILSVSTWSRIKAITHTSPRLWVPVIATMEASPCERELSLAAAPLLKEY